MSHSSLKDYYELMFALEYRHKYTTSEIENWIVFEKDIRVDMILDDIEEQKRRAESSQDG